MGNLLIQDYPFDSSYSLSATIQSYTLSQINNKAYTELKNMNFEILKISGIPLFKNKFQMKLLWNMKYF